MPAIKQEITDDPIHYREYRTETVKRSVAADIRWIDVKVLDEVNPIAVLALSNMGGHATERKKIVRFEKRDAVSPSETLVGKDFFFDSIYFHLNFELRTLEAPARLFFR